jgi:hypothetical protein
MAIQKYQLSLMVCGGLPPPTHGGGQTLVNLKVMALVPRGGR